MDFLDYEECDTPEKFDKLREFAKEFDPIHTVPFNKNRFVIVKKNGVWIGYAEICYTPIVFSSWCKSRCKPRDILDGMKAFVGWAKLEYGEGLTAVPHDTKTFSEPIMNKLGFFKLNAEIYKAG